jgi:hypothetical protein
VALATPVEPLQQHPYGAVEELFQAGGVPVDSVVVVIPTEFRVQPLEEPWQPEVAILLAPRGEALHRGAEFLAGRAAREVILPLAVLASSQLKPQNLEAGFPGESVPTDRDDPCLGARPFQSELLSPLPKPFVEAFRIGLVFECAHEIVCVSNQTRVASTVPFDHFFTPHIKHVVQEHMGEYW